MDFNRMKEEDWFEIGECCKEASEKLCKLIKKSEGKLPPYMINQAKSSLKELCKFKREARNRMKITAKDVKDYFFDTDMKEKKQLCNRTIKKCLKIYEKW